MFAAENVRFQYLKDSSEYKWMDVDPYSLPSSDVVNDRNQIFSLAGLASNQNRI